MLEQAQLFKRLHDMTLDDLYQFIKPTESIQQALFKLDMAARTRHVIHAVQIEDMWQLMPEGSDTFNIYLCMKLSSMTLESCLDLNDGMNSLEWRFVLPKYQDIPADQKPANFGDYLGKMKTLKFSISKSTTSTMRVTFWTVRTTSHHTEISQSFRVINNPLTRQSNEG